jgi:hypothetical protein
MNKANESHQGNINFELTFADRAAISSEAFWSAISRSNCIFEISSAA